MVSDNDAGTPAPGKTPDDLINKSHIDNCILDTMYGLAMLTAVGIALWLEPDGRHLMFGFITFIAGVALRPTIDSILSRIPTFKGDSD